MGDEDSKTDWARGKLTSLTDHHVLALRVRGWKIVRQNPADDSRQWPSDSAWTACPCPDWCKDISKGDGQDDTSKQEEQNGGPV